MGHTPLSCLWREVPDPHLGIPSPNFDSQFSFALLGSSRAQHSQFAPGSGHPAVHSSVWLFLYEHQ